jgi:divalent metal cation (Fe/Co/Zn/Cd) transporter
VEGVLLAGACVGAIVYAVRDLLHRDPVEDAHLVVIYSGVSFALSVLFGQWMRRTGARIASPLVMAEAQLWIIDGWMALGVCAAFVVSMALGRIGTNQANAYVDPVVCIVLSLILLKKPLEILRESMADLVDANPYADTAMPSRIPRVLSPRASGSKASSGFACTVPPPPPPRKEPVQTGEKYSLTRLRCKCTVSTT